MAKVIINGQDENYPDGTHIYDIAARHQNQYKDDIALAVYKGKLTELHKVVSGVGELKFLTTADKNGKKAYRRSVTFMLQCALQQIASDEGQVWYLRVHHSLGQGYFCTIDGMERIAPAFLAKLRDAMDNLVEQNLPLRKYCIKTAQAKEMFHNFNMVEKEQLMKYRASSNVNVYDLEGCIDYFYGYMLPFTGFLKYYDLIPFEEGFMLMFPSKDTRVVSQFTEPRKLFRVQQEAEAFGDVMEVPTVGALNEAIAKGRIQDIILSQEAEMEKRIGELAALIASDKRIKFVMIAGPSSSGKTTFSYRLSAQLRALGCKPHPIALDDFYLNRDQMPLDEFGQKDFESIEGMDIEFFNECMSKLLEGERVLLPEFNFKIGKREFNDKYMQLGEDDILVIEGIHGLNDRMSYSLPAESKYKIYLSALTQLSIDEHNPLSTSDGRLIRRIVRDARTRGSAAAETIAMWDSVRRGEENNIFPFQESANYMFNTALIYEMAVLKLYALPDLYAIGADDPMYSEAKRLIKFLDYFIPIPPDGIPNNSIIREFIGGSCLKV